MLTRIYPVETGEASSVDGANAVVCSRPGVNPHTPESIGNESFHVLAKCPTAPDGPATGESWVLLGFGNVIETDVRSDEISEAGDDVTQSKVNADAQAFFQQAGATQLVCESQTQQTISASALNTFLPFSTYIAGGMWFSEPLIVSDRWKVNQRYYAP